MSDEEHKQQCLERWRKYWRLAQIVAALPSRMERQAAVEKHSADYPWFGDLVKQAWRKRHEQTISSRPSNTSVEATERD